MAKQSLFVLAAATLAACSTPTPWPPDEHVVRRGETLDAIGSRFLLSTDFFRHGGDESRALRYVAYFDPYRSPCANPLAEFDA